MQQGQDVAILIGGPDGVSDELLQQARSHLAYLKTNGMKNYRQQKALTEFTIHFRQLLIDHAHSLLESGRAWPTMMKRVQDKAIDPFSAAEELVAKLLREKK